MREGKIETVWQNTEEDARGLLYQQINVLYEEHPTRSVKLGQEEVYGNFEIGYKITLPYTIDEA